MYLCGLAICVFFNTEPRLDRFCYSEGLTFWIWGPPLVPWNSGTEYSLCLLPMLSISWASLSALVKKTQLFTASTKVNFAVWPVWLAIECYSGTDLSRSLLWDTDTWVPLPFFSWRLKSVIRCLWSSLECWRLAAVDCWYEPVKSAQRPFIELDAKTFHF